MPASKGRFVLFYYLIWLKTRLELPLTLFPPECHICTFSPAQTLITPLSTLLILQSTFISTA